MALASALHHSADKTTRAQYNAPRGQKNAGTEYYVLSDEEDVVPAWGSRPPCLGEPRGPQERDQLRTVEQIAVYAPMVQILDVPVAQMGEQLVDVLHFFDALISVAEQAIEVPKIIIERIPPRTSVREPQLAEQLVEVPTIVSFSSLQRVMEQTVDIPAPQGGGRHADLQSFLRGQSSTGAVQIVDAPRGGLQGFRPGQSSSASSSSTPGVHGSADGPGKGVFRTFPQNKKSAKMGSHSSQRVPASVSPSTPAPHHRTRLIDWVMVLSGERLYFWNRCTGETRWTMEDGYLPSWSLRPDGRYVRLGDGEVFETLDGS